MDFVNNPAHHKICLITGLGFSIKKYWVITLITKFMIDH